MTTNENLRLTYNEFKQIKGCENVKEDQMSSITDTIFELSVLIYKAINKMIKIRENEE